MSQQNSQRAKTERVSQILEMLLEGQPRDKIADQFGYSTWKSLDIYMRRHGFSWNNQTQIYTKTAPETPALEPLNCPNPDNNAAADSDPTEINPEDVVRLFSFGILDARDIAKRAGFASHKEMATYMLRRGYIWSSVSSNYINSNPHSEAFSDSSTEDILSETEEVQTSPSLTGNASFEKYRTLLEFLWQSRDNLIKVIESMNVDDKIRVYHIPGQAKTKSIYLSDSLSDLMTTLCQKHSLSQKQGYEAALVEYLSKYGFRDRVETLLKAPEHT